MNKAKSIRGMHDLLGENFLTHKKIIKLLNNQSLLNKFSKNSLELCDQYAWENVKKYWYKILS